MASLKENRMLFGRILSASLRELYGYGKIIHQCANRILLFILIIILKEAWNSIENAVHVYNQNSFEFHL